MRHEVVLVEELGSLGGYRYETLGLADVLSDDMTNISAKLFSRQLQCFILPQLLSSEIGKTAYFLSPLLHQPPFLFRIPFFASLLRILIDLVSLIADHVEIILDHCLFATLFDLL